MAQGNTVYEETGGAKGCCLGYRHVIFVYKNKVSKMRSRLLRVFYWQLSLNNVHLSCFRVVEKETII